MHDALWLLRAPAGVPSSGPLVLWDEEPLEDDTVRRMMDKGWVLTGPYVLQK